MKQSNKLESVILNVPFYGQRYEFTCGPASLMMAMNYFDKIRLSRELEMDIWREANMAESYGTSRYGLAFSALTRGFKVKIYANITGPGFVRKIESLIGKVNYPALSLFLNERKTRCLNLGAREFRVSKVTEEILRRELISGTIPVVLSNAEYFNAEDIPHWIAVIGIDEEMLYLNNPLDKRGPRTLPLDTLGQAVGYKGDQCMVTVSK